ncbi:FtsK/SpoIIIE domain-containing protein [Arcobacter sp. LA11]|uniref:FtsK/SpoIIIE domain-containing protein n=1 Tax=Arcobacter sp. LA11 TaxID=1898176 RepID=UPI000933606C|nr:FtsK/SpoIIIE domain-containing protein [Arcobacter sp. LA11]
MKQGLKLLALSIIKAWLIVSGGLFLILVIKNGAVAIAIDLLQDNWLTTLIFLTFITLLITGYYMVYWRYIVMPYSLKLISQPKAENKEVSVFLDRFIKYDKVTNTLYYKNRNAIDKKLYQDKQKEILHFLGLHDKSVELDIQEHERKYVKIKIYKLPYSFDFDLGKLKKGSIYYGVSKDGNYYKKLDEQTSMITVGESGSGKSNFMSLIIYSLLYNFRKLDSLIFIDLKGVELAQYNYKHTQFIDTVEKVDIVLKEVKEVMNNRYKIMQEKGHKKFQGKPIFIVIDEIGTIGTHHNKKLRDSIFNTLIELSQKQRAARICTLIFSQKCDSLNLSSQVLTNIQSRVLMKTDSEFNRNATIGNKEVIEEVTSKEVADFNQGRLIFRDGETSNKELIQVPFISQNQHLALVKAFDYLK